MVTTNLSAFLRSTRLLALGVACSLSPIACDGEVGENSDDGETLRGLISTHYLNPHEFTRKICAVGWPKGTYNAHITSKTLWNDQCENVSGVMNPVPAESITNEFCADVGLNVKAAEGGLNYCTTKDSEPTVVDVYCYDFSSWNHAVNYEVVDVGDGEALGSSGWQPSLGNGCPHDGFPYQD